MADKNDGILLVGPIRPQYPTDIFAVAYSDEVRGGLHTVTSSTERDAIYPDRREWGMLCYVINEDKTYQLKLNYYDSDLTQNANWAIYNPGYSESPWSDPIIDIIGTVPGSYNDGDRYIVATPSFGVFLNQSNKIATYRQSLLTWEFTEPSNLTTVRITNYPNTLAVFYGTQSSTGKWTREYQNPIRYFNASSTNGLTYSFNSVTQSQLFTYSNVVYFPTFATSNSGTVSISIDGMEYVRVKKASSNSLVDLVSGDIQAGIQYQMTYDSQNFQILLPSNGASTIGVAESGSYTDGLYTDLTTSTPIGTVVDRFNEILKYMVPPSAPNLTSWGVDSYSNFVSGKISFDATGGFVSGTNSIWGPTAQGGLFATGSGGGYILGITSRVNQTITGTQYYQDITGRLNSGVSVHPSLPYAAYATYSFGNGITGSLYMYLNSQTVSTVDFGTNSSSIDTTFSGLTSGFVLTAATTSKFAQGVEYTSYWNRTGTYRLKRDNYHYVDGLNYLEIIHKLGATSHTLNRFEFVSDSSNEVTTFNAAQGSNYGLLTKFISGIRFIRYLSFNYSVFTQNVYKNTYYPLQDAGFFSDPFDFATPNPASQSLTKPISVTSGFTFSTQYVVKSSRRRTNQSLTNNITVKRTVQGTVVGGTLSVSGWLIDTFATSSTTTIENFDDEKYRLINGGYASYSMVSDITTGTWNSQKSILTEVGYRDALQVIDGGLTYPKTNFVTFGTTVSNPNFGNTQSDYSNCANSTINHIHGSFSRSYTRYFEVNNQSSALKLGLSSQGTNFVNVGTDLNLSTTNAYLEIKLPYKGTEIPPGGLSSDGGVTGWLDCTKDFVPGFYDNGSGCWDQSSSSSTQSLSLTLGEKNTYYSNGYVLMRITTGRFYVGSILGVSMSAT